MLIYSKRYVNVISFIITVIIYVIINITILLSKMFEFNLPSIFRIFKRDIVIVEFNSNNVN